ncbi:tRNA (adenosine(37)-N6)-dimethylallyltransferase MiaA [Candidatus Cloacimonadota bacterium]
MTPSKPLKLITVQGTTASGKSAFALQLAELTRSEIISADSRQIYKFMDIGTAKPTKEVQEKIKHHLIDIITPDQSYNAGRFAREAEEIIAILNSNDYIPIVVGGTGFYIKSLLEGLADIPDIPYETRQSIITMHSSKTDRELHDYLAAIDPDSAQRINYQDRQKLLRAVSVFQFTGKPISSFWQQDKPKRVFTSFNIQISLKRDLIYNRINNRVDKMMDSGLLEEVESLLDKGYKQHDPGMRSVGYQELFPYFNNEVSLDTCIELVKQHTRNYAKRQLTWLKKNHFDLTLGESCINFSQILKDIKEYFRST